MNGVGSEGDFTSGVEDVFLAGFEAWGELGQVSATSQRKPGFFYERGRLHLHSTVALLGRLLRRVR